jgi:hypothetical protein
MIGKLAVGAFVEPLQKAGITCFDAARLAMNWVVRAWTESWLDKWHGRIAEGRLDLRPRFPLRSAEGGLFDRYAEAAANAAAAAIMGPRGFSFSFSFSLFLLISRFRAVAR